MIINNENENAFGFTFVDETEYEAYEKTLKDQLIIHSSVAATAQEKLNRVMAAITPFLRSLGSDPSKIYIKWANRSAKIKELQDRLNAIVKD